MSAYFNKNHEAWCWCMLASLTSSACSILMDWTVPEACSRCSSIRRSCINNNQCKNDLTGCSLQIKGNNYLVYWWNTLIRPKYVKWAYLQNPGLVNSYKALHILELHCSPLLEVPSCLHILFCPSESGGLQSLQCRSQWNWFDPNLKRDRAPSFRRSICIHDKVLFQWSCVYVTQTSINRIPEPKGTYLFTFNAYSKIITPKYQMDLYSHQLRVVSIFLFFC